MPLLQSPERLHASLRAHLREAYGLDIASLQRLHLGADVNAAVFRATTDGGTSYFVKVRHGDFDAISVTLPGFLGRQGIPHLIVPVESRSGQGWTRLDDVTVVVHPFVAGRSGMEAALSQQHWRDLGRALRRIHDAALPPALARGLRRETFSPHARDTVRAFLAALDTQVPAGDDARRFLAFVKEHSEDVRQLVKRAEALGLALERRAPDFTVCHADLHAGNVLIGDDGGFFIVDWDQPVLAPRERDLMFVGGAQGFLGHSAEEEHALFHQGYGPVQVDWDALAYYRHERIVQDIAEYCEQFALASAGEDGRMPALPYLLGTFLPGGTAARARAVDPASRGDGEQPHRRGT